MNSDFFFEKIDSYARLTETSRTAWRNLLKEEFFKKGEFFVGIGKVPTKVAFVEEGLFSQNYISESGDNIIKYFFPEGRLAASVGAMLTGSCSKFSVEALENSKVVTYDFQKFRELVDSHPDIASFYIRYIERHWIIEKEPLEISFRYDTALKRYADFLQSNADLVKRLKKNQIASYLGITPTQLSRLFFSNK